ncbi:glycosyl transferase family 2 [Mucilaginibacter hurinus]|uniref:Glycosyl transferase family 2 n=1 Tax=Mucilaginibacter hurinus TaxID=2201324 RepID=A0A367GQI3_9SPHI|nr:glycosyltransferase [Mucilaginibacter hurinus]RCH55126.1 glycosyl transferase family 2 [Mucilaginibacter hurinus]
MSLQKFDTVTLLVTHYNRSKSLERLLQSFRDLGISFGDLVVSDDGSKPEHLARLQERQAEYNFRLITTPQNRGLGNNINKGQDAIQTPYTLYVQEDFVPTAMFAGHFMDALQFMEEDQSLDIARMYAYFKYPYSRPYKKGFSEMLFSPSVFKSNHLKFYVYSDHPHLRRSNFLQKFGRYPEGLKGDITEYTMALSFIQKKGRGIFYDDFYDLFEQKNSPDEPSTMGRASWRESRNVFMLAARSVYLRLKLLKWTSDYLFRKV